MKVYSIHRQGFSWDDWHVNNLTKENCSKYLQTSQYYAMHPLNGNYSHWIDDKLTLKYLCTGTQLDQYMPRYYFQIDAEGKVLALSDAPETKDRNDFSDIISLLEEIGELALKRVAGSLGEGFYKAEMKEVRYYLNGTEYSREQLEAKFKTLKEYLVTEYLHPHKEMTPFCADTANCIRYLIGRDALGKMKVIRSFIRFGTKASGYVENYNAGGVLCYISESGRFEYGNLFDAQKDKNSIIYVHPDTKVELKGEIPLWNEIQLAAQRFGKHFPQLNYLGIDFVVTQGNEVKVLEINSLTSLDTLQLDGSILKKSPGEFYRKRLKTLKLK